MKSLLMAKRVVGVGGLVLVFCVLLAAGEGVGVLAEETAPTQDGVEVSAGKAEEGHKDIAATESADEGNKESEAAQEGAAGIEKDASSAGGDQTLAVIRLTGEIGEGPEPSLFALAGEVERTWLVELTDRLGQASEDASIDAVLVTVEQPEMTWAQVDELRQALGRVRESGKKTYAYVETVSMLSYLAACGCDEVVMGPEPAGTLLLGGLSGTTLYFGELFEKVGLEADFVHAGAYKSAAEPLTRTGPSEEAKEQMNRLYDRLYAHLLESIASSRGLNVEEVEVLIDRQPIWGARAAQEASLVDRVMTRREFLASLQQEQAGAVRLRLDYGSAKGASLEAASGLGAFGILQQMLAPPVPTAGPTVAVLYVEGMIVSGESGQGWSGGVTGDRTLRMALEAAGKDKDIKAVVLRIDSPGGSAAASEVIHQAVGVCAARKPVVVSMGHVAASGGYYVACGAKTLLAEPSTITGSVGVVGGTLALKGLLEKVGVSAHSYQRGRYAGMFSGVNGFTAAERLELSRHLEEIYAVFKERVAKSREGKLSGPIDELAQGKVYTGREALALGLVDRLGGLADAITLAAAFAAVEEYEVRVLPRPKTLIELLEGFLSGTEQGRLSLGGARGVCDSEALWEVRVGFEAMGGAWRGLLGQCVTMAQLLARERALMVAPFVLSIDP